MYNSIEMCATFGFNDLCYLVWPDPPDGVMMSEVFNSGNVAVTLQWNNLSEVSYSVSVTPNVSAVTSTNSSARLTVMYNTRYNVSIAATNCGGESDPYIRELCHGKTGCVIVTIYVHV